MLCFSAVAHEKFFSSPSYIFSIAFQFFLTFILLMIEDLKLFKTKLFTFRYFFNLCENSFLAGIYLTVCSLGPRPKIFWNTVLFISELCERQATHFFYVFLKSDFFLASPFLLSFPLCAADHMVSFTETTDCKIRQILWLCPRLSWLLYLWTLHSPLITCPSKSCREGTV